MSAQLPPHDLDAEQILVAAALLDGQETLGEVATIVGSRDFYSDSHRRIWDALVTLDAGCHALDVTSVAGYLRDHGHLSAVGGIAGIVDLVDQTPTVGHLAEHARRVAEKASLRRIADVCGRVRAEALAAPENVSEWRSCAEARIWEATSGAEQSETIWTLDEMLDEVQTRLDHPEEVSDHVVPTRFPELDRKLGGGLRRGQKYTLAARPGVGKTGWAISCGLNVAESSYRGTPQGVVFVSLEQPRADFIARAVAQRAGVDCRLLESGKLDPRQRHDVDRAMGLLRGLPLAIDEAGQQTTASVRRAVRRALSRLRRRDPRIELAMVVVDHIHIMTGPRDTNREGEIRSLSNGDRELAKELDCVVLELAQLNRSVESEPDKRPTLKHLRDSGSIEQDSFGVLMLYREDMYRDSDKHTGEAELLIRKVRQYGQLGMVPMLFDGPSTRFMSLDEREIPTGIQDIGEDGGRW